MGLVKKEVEDLTTPKGDSGGVAWGYSIGC
jgi:hypothetical protein